MSSERFAASNRRAYLKYIGSYVIATSLLYAPGHSDNKLQPDDQRSISNDAPISVGIIQDGKAQGKPGIYSETVLKAAIDGANKLSRHSTDDTYGYHAKNVSYIEASPDSKKNGKDCYSGAMMRRIGMEFSQNRQTAANEISLIAVNEHSMCEDAAGIATTLKSTNDNKVPLVILNNKSLEGIDGLILHEVSHLRGAKHSTLMSMNKDYSSLMKPVEDLYPRLASNTSIQSMLSKGFAAFKQEGSDHFSAYGDPNTVMGVGLPVNKDRSVYSAVNLNEINPVLFKLSDVNSQQVDYPVGYDENQSKGISFNLPSDHMIKEIDPSIDKLSIVLMPIYANEESQFHGQPFTYDVMMYFRGKHQNYGYGAAIPIEQQSKPTMQETTVFIDEQISGGIKVSIGKDLMRGLYFSVTKNNPSTTS